MVLLQLVLGMHLALPEKDRTLDFPHSYTKSALYLGRKFPLTVSGTVLLHSFSASYA